MAEKNQSNQSSQSSTPDFNKMELEILKFWEDNKIFEKSLEQTKHGEPYIFYDGPPFATGLPHYGSILPSVIKDCIPRYQTMKGRFVRRRWGWDCHGLPIENIVEQDLNISGKKQIEELGVEKFNQTCRDNVLAFAQEWGKVINRAARWVDFDNSYKTMDTTYMESVWWAIKQIWEKGLIFQDRKVLLYCSRCETPISNFEVAMDNSYRDIAEESVYAKFRMLSKQRIVDNLTHEKTFALAWTTTPWTLPGNTSLNVGPDIRYVLVEQNDERYILAKDRLAILDDGYEIISEFPARALEGLQYEPLYPFFAIAAKGKPGVITAEQESHLHRFYLANFVTITDGTGIVHNAAMYGEDDYQLAKEKDLPRVDMLDHKGQYLKQAPENLRGMFFKDADSVILKDLQEKGLVYKTENYLHSYPHCHRCGTPLFYSALPAWFIDIQKIKPELLKNNEEINWYPQHLKHGRFALGIGNAPDWNISRNRYWATALPFWECEQPECHNIICIGSIAELVIKSLNFEEVYPQAADLRLKIKDFSENLNLKSFNFNLEELNLHKPFIDQVKLKCDKCGGQMTRVPEVVDCWVESGSMPFAELHYPFEHNPSTRPPEADGTGRSAESDLENFQNRFPADFVVEYIPQTRAWFYVMHVVATILFGKAPFRNVLTTGTILAEDGTKMSKSKANYPDPSIVIEKYGADALRFYLLTSPVVGGEDINFSEKTIAEISRKVNLLLYNVWSFFRLYDKSVQPRQRPSPEQLLDKWVLARLDRTIQEVTKQLDDYNTVRAGKELVEFINDLSTWYVRRSRERMKAGGATSAKALEVLGFVLAELAKLLAPLMPFLADYIYRNLTNEESVHLTPWPAFEDPDLVILSEMEVVREIVSTGLAVRKEKALPVRQPLAALAFELSDKKLELRGEHCQLILDELNVKKVDPQLADQDLRGSGVVAVGGLKAVKNFYLDLNLTVELKREGMARELERQVQDLRKKSGLRVGELVDVYYNTQNLGLEDALLNAFDRKKTFVSQISKSLEVEVDFETQSEIAGQAIWLGMIKV
jgi:isoleucyl-tRNA synthetase